MGQFYYVADLFMESRADFEQLLASPEGEAAVADVLNYATGGARFFTLKSKNWSE